MNKAKWNLVALVLGCVAIVLTIWGCSAAQRGGYINPGITAMQPARVYDGSPARIGGPPVITPGVGEELWVISRTETPANVQSNEKVPGSGALLAQLPGAKETVPVPLKHTDVKASIAGYVAAVDVTQQYHNPFSEKIEAIYVFPLPHDAAINEFVMTIGERKIRGIIRERKEAEQIYREAKSQGYTASLMTQERPNVFTQSVANIEPGKEIDVFIRYYHTLAYVDGAYEFVFPMVVGPRFNPPSMSDGIGAVGEGARGVSGQKTEVTYLRPNARSGHDISLSVEIDAGVRIENIRSINHAIQIKSSEGGKASLAIAPGDTIPNKDFVLRYQVAGKTIKSAIFTQKDAKSGYFTLMLMPPASLEEMPRKPLEMVFTLDTSGSMEGRPLEQSKAAMRWALLHMNAEDTFQIIRFGDRADMFFERPVPATRENVESGLRWIEATAAGGGTMLVDGLRASLRFPHDPNRLRVVAFLTDGFIGNEAEALKEIHASLGPARIFSFGVGSSTNRYLMEHMAKMGNGAAAFLSLNERGEEAMEPFFNRVSHPAMTDISVDFGGMDAKEVYPQRLPDLMVGRPVILTGKYSGHGEKVVKVKGMVAGEAREISIPVNLDQAGLAMARNAIPAVWARARIMDLVDRSAWDGNVELAQSVKALALEYGLMSPFTAFVAVDATAVTAGDHGTSMPVPVLVPDGVRYETTVRDKGNRGVRE
jgi:Ca-activated chloride channel family protein